LYFEYIALDLFELLSFIVIFYFIIYSIPDKQIDIVYTIIYVCMKLMGGTLPTL